MKNKALIGALGFHLLDISAQSTTEIKETFTIEPVESFDITTRYTSDPLEYKSGRDKRRERRKTERKRNRFRKY